MDVRRPYRVGDWIVEPALDEIRRGEQRVKLEPRMMRLLCCLAETPGDVVSTGTLLDRVWPGVVVSPSSVYQAIAQLRRELGDRDTPPRYIATVPRKGYRLVAPVAPAERDAGTAAQTDRPPDTGPVPARPAPAPSPSVSPSPAWRRPAPLALAAAFLAAALAWIAVGTLRSSGKSAEAPMPTVAVLPFADLSLDKDGEVFSAGITDELLNALARVPGVRVIGRTSSARFAGGAVDVRDVGRQLGVTHVVEGSVRRAGGRLRVTVQLVSTADGFEVWANSFDRPATDLIAIQTEIGRAVVDALAVQLSPAAAERLARAPTTQVNAYELYLLGRHQQLKRTPDALARAIEYHRAALREDPSFALAHAGLADAYMARYYYENRPLEETAPLVQGEVDAALRLDPELAEAYAAWGVLLTEQWRMTEAIRVLERALAINPNQGETWIRLGAAYEYAGEPRKALDAYAQAALLDPLHTVLHVRRCLTLQNLGRYAEAETACRRAFELQPDIPNALWAQGLNAYAQGDLADAVRHHREALERAPNRRDIRSELVTLYLDLGLAREAASELRRLAEIAEPAEVALAEARLHLAGGDTNAALRALRALPADAAPRARAEAALLALAAGDVALAGRLGPTDESGARSAEEILQPGLYRTRWGACELCGAALVAQIRGNDAEAARLLDTLAGFLDRTEGAGHVWHALHYLRACVQAQRGDVAAALDSLERAVAMGWRRAWWMRLDPTLAPLRGDERFGRLLMRVEAASGAGRSRLAAAP